MDTTLAPSKPARPTSTRARKVISHNPQSTARSGGPAIRTLRTSLVLNSTLLPFLRNLETPEHAKLDSNVGPDEAYVALGLAVHGKVDPQWAPSLSPAAAAASFMLTAFVGTRALQVSAAVEISSSGVHVQLDNGVRWTVADKTRTWGWLQDGYDLAALRLALEVEQLQVVQAQAPEDRGDVLDQLANQLGQAIHKLLSMATGREVALRAVMAGRRSDLPGHAPLEAFLEESGLPSELLDESKAPLVRKMAEQLLEALPR